MPTSATAPESTVRRPQNDQLHVNGADSSWGLLYKVAGAAALVSVGFVGVAVLVFIANPPPSAITEGFALFPRNP